MSFGSRSTRVPPLFWFLRFCHLYWAHTRWLSLPTQRFIRISPGAIPVNCLYQLVYKMLPFRRTFVEEKTQLQELNKRLSQYLCRVKQLEQENAFLTSEIKAIRQEETAKWEDQHMAELRELRRTVDQLSFEKSKAEMERQKLLEEFKMLQALHFQESAACNHVNGELRACEKQLEQAEKNNGALERHLLQLQNEYTCLENVHKKEIGQLRGHVHSRTLSVCIQRSQDVPEITMEELDKYSRTLSETCTETFEIYCRRIADMQESLKLGEIHLDNLRKEKMQYTSEFKKLSTEVEKQNRLQVHLEEELRNLQARFCMERSQYQGIIEELQEESRLLANAISEKLRDHRDLMQIKMGLSLEVAAYRALLEGEGKEEFVRTDDPRTRGSRKIDIKMPLYTSKGASMTKQEGWKWRPANIGIDNKYKEQTSSTKVSSGVTRVVPITVYGADQRSSSSQKDLLSFTRASRASTSAVKGVLNTERNAQIQKNVREQRTAIANESQHSAEDSVSSLLSGLKVRSNPSPTEDSKSAKVTSPSTVNKVINAQKGGTANIMGETSSLEKEADLSMTQGKTTVGLEINGVQDGTSVAEDCLAQNKLEGQISNLSQFEDKLTVRKPCAEDKSSVTEEKILESVSVEEIIENVVKPAGLDTKVTYHVEKSEEEDGRVKTQIILQSKVEEDLDVLDETDLKELLSKRVKNIVLEDIKGTPTGSMIENLLSLGLQGDEDLENKLVNIEIVEEPVKTPNNEESEIKMENPFIQRCSEFFQTEELANFDEKPRHPDDSCEENRASVTPSGEYWKTRSVHIEESSGDLGSPIFGQAQETEYYVSSPDDNISDSDDVPLSSFGHYGALDDLSDERYYQNGTQINQIFKEDDQYEASPTTTYIRSEHTLDRDSFPECIIEEEVHVSPIEQESLIELIKKDNTDPKEQFLGALEQLQGTVSETLKEELALFTKNEQECLDNLAVDIRKVQQAEDSGTMTIVAELNVSQSLEGSGLLEEKTADAIFEEKLLAALRSCSPGPQQTIRSRNEDIVSEENGEHVSKVTEHQDAKVVVYDRQHSLPTEESTNQINKTEKHIKLGPSEKLFTFQMDISNIIPAVSTLSSSEAQSSNSQGQNIPKGNSDEMKENRYGYMELATTSENREEMHSLDKGHPRNISPESVGFSHLVQSQMVGPHLDIQHEKRIAMVYLESQEDN